MKTTQVRQRGYENSSRNGSYPTGASMNGQLSMSNQATLPGFDNATSSPASVAGHTRSVSPDGRKIVKSGPGAAPASPSAWQEKETARLTKDTYGPLFDASSPSAGLQTSLWNR